jgi:lipooligosaccharide transport system permease protein
MFFFCGVFYPIDTLPAFVQIIAQILPLTHAVALILHLLTELTLPWLHIGVPGTKPDGGGWSL